MGSDAASNASALALEVAALARVVVHAERERDQRLDAKLAELDAWLDKSGRIQRLITGGAARREARLRALEDAVEALAAECARASAPRPLDLPRNRHDPSVVDMRSAEPEPTPHD